MTIPQAFMHEGDHSTGFPIQVYWCLMNTGDIIRALCTAAHQQDTVKFNQAKSISVKGSSHSRDEELKIVYTVLSDYGLNRLSKA